MSALAVDQIALDDARRYFEQQGARGLEGTAMLAGEPGRAITRCLVPDQVARRTALGVSVEVTSKGKLELATGLDDDERWLARIHSHPAAAYHSPTDDENPGLTAQGSYSIVVPFFGLGLRRGLEACAAFVRQGQEWVEIPAEDLGHHLLVR